MREEEECAAYRQRAGRLQKWREMVEDAAKEKNCPVSLPSGVQSLVVCFGFIVLALVVLNCSFVSSLKKSLQDHFGL